MSEYKAKLNPFTGQLQLVPTNIVLSFKAGVATSANLPLTGNAKGDTRLANDNGHLYVWSIEATSGLLTDWVDAGDVVDLNWAAIANKPSSLVADIDDAVSKRHTSGSDDQTAATVLTNDSGESVQDKLDTLEGVSHTQNTDIILVTDDGKVKIELKKADKKITFTIYDAGDVAQVFEMDASTATLTVPGLETPGSLGNGGGTNVTIAEIKGAVDDSHASGSDNQTASTVLTDETGVSVQEKLNALEVLGHTQNTDISLYINDPINCLAPDGAVTVGSVYGGYGALNTLDGDLGTYWASNTESPSDDWWKYDFGVGITKIITVLRMHAYVGSDSRVKNFTISGSNDDSSWTLIYTGLMLNENALQEFSFANLVAYRYYKIDLIDNYFDNGYAVNEIQLYQTTVPLVENGELKYDLEVTAGIKIGGNTIEDITDAVSKKHTLQTASTVLTDETGVSVQDHIDNISNPHTVTASQVGAAEKHVTIDEKTDNYTLVLTDDGKFIDMNVTIETGVTNVTLTIPKNSVVAFPIGTTIAFRQKGDAPVVITPVDGDVTIEKEVGLTTTGQHAVASILKVATDTWIAFGALEA